MIWSLGYTRLSYHEQAERAIGQIYVSITTNDFHRVNYQIQQVFLYKGSHSKNPGPIENRTLSDSSISSVSNIHKYMKNNVSFLNLNVQSLKPKLDLISEEYGDFDIHVLSFTETWIKHSTLTVLLAGT
jgi:hypothetical protein